MVTADTEFAGRPGPRPDSVTAPYWDAANQGYLAMQRCSVCHRFHFPPVPLCSTCSSQHLEWQRVSGRGVIHSFTVINHEVVAGVQPPYVVVEVELAEQAGLLMIANLINKPAPVVSIGAPVRTVFEALSNGQALPQFALVEEG